jgi:two-component sensor histidine kinase
MLDAEDASIGRSLCQMCSDAGTSIILQQQEIELTLLRNIRPRVLHVLTVPLHDTDRHLGVLWLAQLTSTATFSRPDAHVLGRLANVLVLGLRLLADAQERARLEVPAAQERATHAEAMRLLHLERTARRQSDANAARAASTVAFKDAAIGEAHHRVKNTLQIVSSLLSLQARSSAPETRRALLEARTRLDVLKHAHECLSGTVDRKEASLSQLLRVIADALPSAFADISARIRLQLTADPISVSADDATAIALIANELVTNAYKHAFTGREEGTITLRLTSTDEAAVVLQVADDGSGEGCGQIADSFGMSLVRRLAQQVCGTLSSAVAKSGQGTVLTLTVPRAPATRETTLTSVAADRSSATADRTPA